MLKNKRPTTLAAELTVEGQGDKHTIILTYQNLTQKEIDAMAGDTPDYAAALVQRIVKEWDTGYDLDLESIKEFESDFPFITVAIIAGFHNARRMALTKN